MSAENQEKSNVNATDVKSLISKYKKQNIITIENTKKIKAV